MNILPINLDDLIHLRSVESVRREFKRTWSEPTLDQTIRSICAFANDFFNLNGGYIVLGVEEQNGAPILPPQGLDDQDLDEIQKQIRGNCKRIDPEYQPVMSPEIYQGKQILVVWCPAGDTRPYQAPQHLKGGDRAYYVRQGSETVEAKGDILTQLMQLTAKVPFDDRRNLSATIETISPALVRNFLSDIKSDLVAPGISIPDYDIYRNLRISARVNGYEVPRNVALLFFVNEPEEYLPGARIEVVEFGDDAGGDLIEERTFRGPIQLHVHQALDYLNSFSTTMLKKVAGRAEVHKTVAFPYEAMEEALVNAVYHRSYEGMPEPVKVYLYPDRMEIISYPGPVPGIEMDQFGPGHTVPPVPNRNRRIGEFLKELRLAEGRGTGIPKIRRKMTENGSPEPRFEFDVDRTYFRVVLPAHPQYVVIHALRESARLWAVGERHQAVNNLKSALKRVPTSGALVAQCIEYAAATDDLAEAETLFSNAERAYDLLDRHLPFVAMAKVYLDNAYRDSSLPKRASEILSRVPLPSQPDDILELAILHKRADRLRDAHDIFSRNYDALKDDAKAVHEYAQTKMKLALGIRVTNRNGQVNRNAELTRKRLLQETVELLRRAIQLSGGSIRDAWCWYDLARSLEQLRGPDTDVLQAYSRAMELLPTEPRFQESYDRWRQHKR